MPINTKCKHLDNLVVLSPDKDFCEECIKTGDSWVHLRKCQTCGITLCCNSSSNQHALKHFQHMHHPVIISAEIGEFWAWCFEDNTMKNYKKK